MTPWPFSWFPGWLNFLAIWTGYSILLVTAYCSLIAIVRWWVGYHYQDEIEDWNEMRRQAQKVRDDLGKRD